LGIKREEGLRRRAIRLSALALLVACAAPPVRAETVTPETIKIGLLKTSSSAVTADGKRQDQAEAPAIYAIIAGYVGQTVEQLRPALAYVDGQGRIDVDDVMRQIAWYRDRGFLKNAASAEKIVDRRFVTAMSLAR
jgi:hypothetical protein